ncbi:hypothetical protein GCM10012287_48460 [Streptomyces daqingensis]|uniref:Uncharacterized protein n=1 Tax=Streptomyces daqingensis TaxID=1472640 RepID=A0ABQ2MP78_9ACTN|nr:hypothetical protein [Streptomyces daqingensis]GGO55967.1 hypothetical protein GCM10012287_48460 [Streptomyces daqingensis]
MHFPDASTAAPRPQGAYRPLDDSKLRIGWIMPPFFHELPVDAPDADSAAERLHSLATTLLAEHSTDDQYAFALLLGAQLEPMTENNVIYAGLSFLEVDGQPTSSTVLVAQLPRDGGGDDETVLTTLQDTLKSTYTDDEVEQTDLPCGPAVSRIGRAPFVVESTSTGEVTQVERQLIQTYVPLPGTAEMLLFELGVFSPEGWELHSEVFAEVLKTIDWATDQEIAEAAMLAQSGGARLEAADALGETAKRGLDRISDEVLRAVTDREGIAREDERLSATVCSACWDKGLRSPCVGHQAWQLSGVGESELEAALPRLVAHFSESGWRVEDLRTDGLRAQTEEHAVKASTEPVAGRLLAEVSSVCNRLSNQTVADDFG